MLRRDALQSKFRLYSLNGTLTDSDKFRGVVLYYLPAYSPDLNPIEESFSYVKAHLHRNALAFRSILQSRNEVAIHHMLKTTLNLKFDHTGTGMQLDGTFWLHTNSENQQ